MQGEDNGEGMIKVQCKRQNNGNNKGNGKGKTKRPLASAWKSFASLIDTHPPLFGGY